MTSWIWHVKTSHKWVSLLFGGHHSVTPLLQAATFDHTQQWLRSTHITHFRTAGGGVGLVGSCTCGLAQICSDSIAKSTGVIAIFPGCGGTFYVRAMGRLCGIDLLFQGTRENVEFRLPFFKVLKNILIFRYLRKKSLLDPFLPRHRFCPLYITHRL